jgi:cardiolipin synthase (CMP-forming)
VFIEEYLQDLRRDRFAPQAIGLYARRAARRARDTLVTGPGAVRSLWAIALAVFALSFVASGTIALVDDRRLGLDFFVWTTVGMLPVFGLVTLHLDLLRDARGYRLSAVNLPTALTLLRICTAPGICLFLVERHFALALWTYVGAEFTDVADGWLARRWRQVTRMGAVLDPIVDIVFHVVLFSGLFVAGVIPAWIFTAAMLRYGIFLVGGAYLYLFVGQVAIRPTLFGRLTGIVMVTLAAFLVLLHVVQGPWAGRLVGLTQIALGTLMVAAVGQVIALGWYNLRVMRGQAAEVPGRVVGDVRWGGR